MCSTSGDNNPFEITFGFTLGRQVNSLPEFCSAEILHVASAKFVFVFSNSLLTNRLKVTKYKMPTLKMTENANLNELPTKNLKQL